MAITDKFKVTEYEAKSYSFRFENGMNWAIFTLNDHTGEFTIQSDWGDYTYRWNIAGLGKTKDKDGTTRNTTLHEFLAGVNDPNYIVRKLAMAKHRSFRSQFDAVETKKDMLNAICEARREQDITKEQARYGWGEIQDVFRIYVSQYDDPVAEELMLYDNWPSNMGDSDTALYGHKDMPALGIFCEMHEWMVYKESAEWTFCEKKLIPLFLGWLRPRFM